MSRQTDAIKAALEREVANACKALILEIDANLRATTPVDTGHARASWVPSVGAPFAGAPTGASVAEHDAGVAAVLAYQPGDGSLFVSTNVPYMARLNGGSSSQAPAGFIEAAVDRAQNTISARYVGKGIAFGPKGVP